MQQSNVTCRYCGESFVPAPSKPGFIDECPNCLYERTVPLKPKGLERLDKEARIRFDKAIASFRRNATKAGVTPELIDQLIEEIIATCMA